ncbi:MAG: hypothetical protein AB8C84_05460 [Oligoflexales bacterium]
MWQKFVVLNLAFLTAHCGQPQKKINNRGSAAEVYDTSTSPSSQVDLNSSQALGPNKQQLRLDIPLTIKDGVAITRASSISTRMVAEILDPDAKASITASHLSEINLAMSLKGPSGGVETLYQNGPIAYFDLQFTDEDGEYEVSAPQALEFTAPEPIKIIVDRQGPNIQGSGEFKTVVSDSDEKSYFLTVALDVDDLTGANCILRDPDKNELPADYINGEQGDTKYKVQLISHALPVLLEYVSLDCVDLAGNINAFNLVSEQ